VSVGDDLLILGPVSLEVSPGSLVALMGASGSGKSTLLHALAGIAETTAGTETWAAAPTTSSVQALGYVPQRESVHDRLTTREALHYEPPDASVGGVTGLVGVGTARRG